MKEVLSILLVVSFLSLADDQSGKATLDKIAKEFGEQNVDKKVAIAFEHIYQKLQAVPEVSFGPISKTVAKSALSVAAIQPKVSLFTARYVWEVVDRWSK